MSSPSPTRRPVPTIAEPEPPLAVALLPSDLRKANGRTPAEVSRRTRVAISTLSKIENGQAQPAYNAMTRLAAALEIDFVDLLGGSTHPRFRAPPALSPGLAKVRISAPIWVSTRRLAPTSPPSRRSPC